MVLMRQNNIGMLMPSVNFKFSTNRRLSNEMPQEIPFLFGEISSKIFLPSHINRKGEGGLRKMGLYKKSTRVSRDKELSLITVITVVFNGAATLEKSICSVIDQDFDNIEYLIIDGGSTDDSIEILKKYDSAIDYWVSEPDSGIYDAFNKAVICSTGDWICFIGADDFFWGNDSLTQMANELNLIDSNVNLVYGNVVIVNSQQLEIGRVGESWDKSRNKMDSIMAIPHPGLMHRRSWFEKYGLFDTSYRIAGDYELILRGWPHENARFVSNCIIVGMAQGGVSSSPENTIDILKESSRAQKKHGIYRHFPNARLLLVFLSAYLRLYLHKAFGKRAAYRLIDIFRRCLGRPAYWTKL